MPNPTVIPVPSRPVVNGMTPIVVTSPVDIPNFTDAYGEFQGVVSLFAKDVSSYRDGVRIGYELLTSCPVDFGIGCFAVRCHAARVALGQKPGVGQGAEDVWRLLTENNMDVAAVVARVGD